jgi:hypothetical protein
VNETVGTVKREDHEGGYSIWVRVGRSAPEWDKGSRKYVTAEDFPVWLCVHSTTIGNLGYTFDDLPDSIPTIGVVPGTPAAEEAR